MSLLPSPPPAPSTSSKPAPTVWPILAFRDALGAVEFLTTAFGFENRACCTRDDDPDGLFARAMDAGAELVRGLVDEDYGSRGFTVRDPEGNLWSFGTYAGE